MIIVDDETAVKLPSTNLAVTRMLTFVPLIIGLPDIMKTTGISCPGIKGKLDKSNVITLLLRAP